MPSPRAASPGRLGKTENNWKRLGETRRDSEYSCLLFELHVLARGEEVVEQDRDADLGEGEREEILEWLNAYHDKK